MITEIKVYVLPGVPTVQNPAGDEGFVTIGVRWLEDGVQFASYMGVPAEAVKVLESTLNEEVLSK